MNPTIELEPGYYKHTCQHVLTRGKRAGELCGHVWYTSDKRPHGCPKCNSRQWDRGTTRQDEKLTMDK